MTKQELDQLNKELSNAQWTTPTLNVSDFAQAIEIDDLNRQLNQTTWTVGNQFHINTVKEIKG